MLISIRYPEDCHCDPDTTVCRRRGRVIVAREVGRFHPTCPSHRHLASSATSTKKWIRTGLTEAAIVGVYYFGQLFFDSLLPHMVCFFRHMA